MGSQHTQSTTDAAKGRKGECASGACSLPCGKLPVKQRRRIRGLTWQRRFDLPLARNCIKLRTRRSSVARRFHPFFFGNSCQNSIRRRRLQLVSRQLAARVQQGKRPHHTRGQIFPPASAVWQRATQPRSAILAFSLDSILAASTPPPRPPSTTIRFFIHSIDTMDEELVDDRPRIRNSQACLE